ncbi:response regulator (plasmid) [Vibrio sp. SS-MA-C1-2]|nr:response regulator [Vibrio sp. SS-MA-C1-2]UJF20362.1 response regulator [Vibrio sp. SS-MA-C1-2]
MYKVLIVDDHEEIRELLERFLIQYDFSVVTAKDGDEMLSLLKHTEFSLIVLDVMMPGKDGLTLCRELRSCSNIPIILLTANSEDVDKIIGLEMGADDYLTKPFNPRELLARIKALIRRSEYPYVSKENNNSISMPSDECYTFDKWTMNITQQQLFDDQKVETILTNTEFHLLKVLVENPQRVLSREQILGRLKGNDSDIFDRAIDTGISRLRKKLEVDAKRPKIIKTIWGGGYQFMASVVKCG